MSVQSDVKKALDALGADIAALQSQCASLASQVGSLSSGIDSSGTGWIRFSDGTQVCNANTGSDVYVTFPKPFNARPSVVIGDEGSYTGSPGFYFIQSNKITPNGFNYSAGKYNDNLGNSRNYIAVGRWK